MAYILSIKRLPVQNVELFQTTFDPLDQIPERYYGLVVGFAGRFKIFAAVLHESPEVLVDDGIGKGTCGVLIYIAPARASNTPHIFNHDGSKDYASCMSITKTKAQQVL